MNEMEKVERFEVGRQWTGPEFGGSVRLIVDTNAVETTYYCSITQKLRTTPDTPGDWRRSGYILLPAKPDADRLTALEEQVAALTARVDALERPAEAEPTADVPRDCTGREVLRDQVVAYGEALFEVTGDSLIPVCILPNDGWNYGQEASFIAADWAECRILWPIADGTEGKR
jgi:hypothetical protein